MAVYSVEKAIVLLVLNKVDLVESQEGRVLRSKYAELPFPTVVRVRTYKKVPNKKIPLTKRNILRRDNYVCQYCTSERDLTIDHVQPKSRGGADSWTNLVSCCRKCNNTKNDQTPEEVGMTLKRKPHRPHHIAFLKSISKEVSPSWEPYLFA